MPIPKVRFCPVCRVYPLTKAYRPFCPVCFHRMPKEMSTELTRLWNKRVTAPAAYHEKLADVILWYMDSITKQIEESDGRP